MRVNKQPVKLESKVEKEQGIYIYIYSNSNEFHNYVGICRPSSSGANPQQQQHSVSPHNPVPGASQPPPSHTYTSPHQYHSLTPVRVIILRLD